MGEIVEFKKGSDEEGPFLTGDCRCLSCSHEWVGVTPAGVHENLECPSCKLFKGVHVAMPTPKVAWRCNCGCFLFFVSDWKEILCANCGLPQRF